MNKNGLILFETDDVVCIVTGLVNASDNDKTGGMLQIWFLYRHINPVEANQIRLDEAICFDCVHLGVSCYVNLGQAPLAIWNCYNNNNYEHWDNDLSVFRRKLVRFGALGEPVIMPIDMMRDIAGASTGWTGYTHRWSRFPRRKQWLMASVDSDAEKMRANALGWRTFRLTSQAPEPDELMCPSSAEAGKETTCSRCLLCNGETHLVTKPNIIIHPHGAKGSRFEDVLPR